MVKERNQISLEEIEILKEQVNDALRLSNSAWDRYKNLENRYENLDENINSQTAYNQDNITSLWSYIGDICFFLATKYPEFDCFMKNLNSIHKGLVLEKYKRD